MYVCIYVYMYICIYVYTYICIHIYIYICMYVYTYICIYVCMYKCIYVYMSIFECTAQCCNDIVTKGRRIYIYIHTCIHTYIIIHTYIHTHIPYYVYIYHIMCISCIRIQHVRSTHITYWYSSALPRH